MKGYQFMEDGGLMLIAVTPDYVEMLRRLPAIAHGDGSERFRAPDPMDSENRSPEARDLRDDWLDLVVPELHEVFDNQHAAVSEVLDNAKPSDLDRWLQFHEKFTAEEKKEIKGRELVDLVIPPPLVEPFYGALNQGRLALHARYGEGEGEFISEEDGPKSDSWEQAREHYLFYSFLQYPLMQLMRMEFEEGEES